MQGAAESDVKCPKRRIFARRQSDAYIEACSDGLDVQLGPHFQIRLRGVHSRPSASFSSFGRGSTNLDRRIFARRKSDANRGPSRGDGASHQPPNSQRSLLEFETR